MASQHSGLHTLIAHAHDKGFPSVHTDSGQNVFYLKCMGTSPCFSTILHWETTFSFVFDSLAIKPFQNGGSPLRNNGLNFERKEFALGEQILSFQSLIHSPGANSFLSEFNSFRREAKIKWQKCNS